MYSKRECWKKKKIKNNNIMLNGVMVAQMFLVHLVMVRIRIQLQKKANWLYI